MTRARFSVIVACLAALASGACVDSGGGVGATDGSVSAAEDGSTEGGGDGRGSDGPEGPDATTMADAAHSGDGGGDGKGAEAGDGSVSSDGGLVDSDGGVESVSGICTREGRWCLYDPYPIGGSFNAIWGTSLTDLWLTGEDLGTLHYDGTAWTRYFLALGTLSGTSSTDLWGTVGFQGATGGTIVRSPNLMHWDGTRWTSVPTGSAFDLTSVWAQSATDVFAFGVSGTILHFDGRTWTKQTSGTISDLGSPWGFVNDVWAASSAGILHYDGTTWSAQSSTIIGSLWGTSSSDMWACGATVNHWNGSSWSQVANPPAPVGSCFGRSSNDVLFSLGGAASGEVLQSTGTADGGLVPITLPPPAPTCPTNRYTLVWAVGTEYVLSGDSCYEGNALIHGSPGAWVSSTVGSAYSVGLPELIWNAGGGTYYGIGRTGVPNGFSILTATGTTPPGRWTAKGDIGTSQKMNAMWGSGPSDVWAVGVGGIVTHYNGSAWTPQVLPQPAALTDVWGSAPNDVWATGGSSFHWDGAQWTAAGPGGAVVSGTASDDVWIAGGQSASHWDGSAWTAYPLSLVLSDNTIVRLNAFAKNDAWLVTSLGDVLHWNGSAWSGTANAYCSTGGDAGSCGSPLISLSGSGGHGFVWNASGDGWASVGLPPSPGTPSTSTLWHTTGSSFTRADTVSTAYPFVGPGAVFGGPGNAWAAGVEASVWKLR